MTEGFGLIPPDATYPNQVAALMGDRYTALNYSVGGQTMATMATDAATQIDPLYYPPQRQVVIAWGGTNDLYFGASAATTYARIVAYATARKAAGWRVILLTILPRSNSGTPAGFEVARQAVNASLLADFPAATGEAGITTGAAYADYLVHVGGDSMIGDAGDELNTTYYLDKVHLTSAGYAIVADYVKKAILLFP